MNIRAERLLPRVLLPASIISFTVAAAMTGAWDRMPIPHDFREGLLYAVGAIAAASAFLVKGRNPFGSVKAEIEDRLDAQLEDPNRPAKELNSRHVSGVKENYDANIRKILKEQSVRFEPVMPRVSKFSQFLAAAAIAVPLVTGTMAGEHWKSNLAEAFNFEAPYVPPPPPDVIAWIEPPDGFDGNTVYLSGIASGGDAALRPVLEGSTLHVIVRGSDPAVFVNDGEISTVDTEMSKGDEINHIYEETVLRDESYTIKVEGGQEWEVTVLPNEDPVVELTDIDLDWRSRDRLELRCKAEDKDEGDQVVEGSIIFRVPGAMDSITPPEEAKIPRQTIPGSEFCNRSPRR